MRVTITRDLIKNYRVTRKIVTHTFRKCDVSAAPANVAMSQLSQGSLRFPTTRLLEADYGTVLARQVQDHDHVKRLESALNNIDKGRFLLINAIIENATPTKVMNSITCSMCRWKGHKANLFKHVTPEGSSITLNWSIDLNVFMNKTS